MIVKLWLVVGAIKYRISVHNQLVGSIFNQKQSNDSELWIEEVLVQCQEENSCLRNGHSQTDNKKGAAPTTPSFLTTRLAASRNQNFRPFRVGPSGWIAQKVISSSHMIAIGALHGQVKSQLIRLSNIDHRINPFTR